MATEAYSGNVMIAKENHHAPDEFVARLTDWTPNGGYTVLTQAVIDELGCRVDQLTNGEIVGSAVLEETQTGVTVSSINIDC